ncbi:extracellular solute-binding protein [Microlunatus parietis]|uniref:Multiple sugar transport system substrate-binding protein n=1 Tax=Microlunatus parietis TaxID=682979 RepID=A0A7Y9IFW9_9ACTN|nr:extracellular solute-binding protein [Microlunatus parietis]NYE75469.1 multiple sugar transport system substrate-binding protein [Microlunatus parietis]
MDRRALLSGGVALGAGGLVAGCGGAEEPDVTNTNPDQVSGKVVHWTYPMGETQQDAWWKPLVTEFTAKYPKVEVQVVQQPWTGREQALTTAVAGKSAPDVVYFNPDFVPRFVEEDLLFVLDEALGEDRSDYVDAAVGAFTYQEKLYGLPLLMTIANPAYNVKLLQQLGLEQPPVSWDEIRDVARQCVAENLTFANYQASDGSLNLTFYPFLWQAGGQVLSDDLTKAAFQEEPGVKALQLLRELADLKAFNNAGLTQAVGKFEQTPFARGTELMSIALDAPVPEAIMPAGSVAGSPPFKDQQQVTFGSVGGLSIFKTTESPEAAVAWAKFVTEKATMEKFLKAAGFLPPRNSLKDMWAGNEFQAFKMQFVDQVNVGVLHPKAREVIDTVRPHIQGCLLGKTEPEAALTAAAAEVDGLLSR